MSTAKNPVAEVKRGATFSCNVQFKVDGVAQDFSVTELSSKFVHASEGSLGTATFTRPSAGLFVLTVQTTGWPLGEVAFDVKRTKVGGGVDYTPTMTLMIVEALTP